MTVREMIDRLEKIDNLVSTLKNVANKMNVHDDTVEIPSDDVGYLIFYLGFLKDKYLDSEVE